MAQFKESEHPRDEEGKFTNKNKLSNISDFSELDLYNALNYKWQNYEYFNGKSYEEEAQNIFDNNKEKYLQEELQDLKEWYDSEFDGDDEDKPNENELIQVAKDNIYYHKENYMEKIMDELDRKCNEVYYKVPKDIENFVDDINELLPAEYNVVYRLQKSHSISAGRNPSQYIIIRLENEEDGIINEWEYRLSDGHKNNNNGDTKYTYLSFFEEYDRTLNGLKSNIIEDLQQEIDMI